MMTLLKDFLKIISNRVIIKNKKLNKKVAELGNLITEDYKDKYPVLKRFLDSFLPDQK